MTIFDWVNQGEYLRRLDARKVLEHYDAENVVEQATHDGDTEIIHSCLLDRVDRHHNNGDSHPSASCNVEKKLYVCYGFWGGTLFHLIQKLEDKSSFAEIVPLLSPMLSESTVEPDKFAEEIEKLLSDPDHRRTAFPSYSDRVLAPWAFVHPWLYERGVDADTASRLQIGWREQDNRIIIPHFWDGNLVGWQARAIPPRPGQWPGTPQPQPKYRNSPGFPKSDTLYYDNSRDFPSGGTVLVVESPFSVIRAVSLGLEVPVVATFGAKVSSVQSRILAEFDEVIIWSDPDPAGASMRRSLSESLYRHCVVKVVEPDPEMDLADYPTLSSVEAKLAEAVPAAIVLAGGR